MKKTFSAVMASVIAVSGMSAFSASAETVDNNVGAAVSGSAGMYFQTDMYTAHDAFGGTWGPTAETPACFPNTIVGINGGEFGWDTEADVPVTAINGDGTYTVSFKTNGVINTAPTETKKWFLDADQKYSRMGAPWSILGNYICTSDLTADLAQEDLVWEFATKNRDNNKCYLDEAMTKEVTVSDVSVDMCGKEIKVDEVKFECDKYIQLSLINIWGSNSIDAEAFPENDGVVSVKFTIKGLSETKKDLSKDAKVTVAKTKAYTGKALKPAVTVKVGSKTLKKGTDYTVSYKNNKKPGKATVTVTGKGNYTGKKSASFVIVPKKQAAPKVKALGKQKIKVTVKKDKLGSGYKVQYSTDKKFKKGVKTVTISKNSTTSKTIAKLKKGKTYYVRTAAFVKVGKKAYVGAYSKAKSVKVK